MSHTYKKSAAQSFSGSKSQQPRRATPDSEALASSDEDAHDLVLGRVRSNPVAARRQSSSWLNDIQPHRKVSLGGGSQTGGSQPPTPSAEYGASQQSRPGAAPSAFPWNAGVFTAPRDGASRLKENLTSPTTIGPGESSDNDPSPIGFLLNQHPVRKAVRSQSYSVGQQDDGPTGPNLPAQSSNRLGRGGASASVRHRPSKPSLLGESPLDNSGLPQLLEDEDDMNSLSNGSEGGMKLPASYWTKPDNAIDAGSNALLRQAAEQNARARHRVTTTGSPIPYNRRKTAGPRGMSLNDYESAIDEIEDNMGGIPDAHLSGYGRRYSEHIGGLDLQPIEDDGSKKPQWTSSLSFGEGYDTHSRRHSFADPKSHQIAQSHSQLALMNEEDDEYSMDNFSPNAHQSQRQKDYFNGMVSLKRSLNEQETRDSHPAPEMGMDLPINPYAVPDVINRPTRRFYMVAFKCSRSDVYYLPENTGLDLRRGDMVITEGDRGVDLGTVTHANVTLSEAKQYKELAAIEHFRWLMMFSRHAISNNRTQAGPDGLLAHAHTPLAAALKDMTGNGQSLPQQYAQIETEVKPRLIRRVAQQHEIQVLREKEGSEAKAKRICQTKVAEHGLNMEILDAEYQLDYKKLTFYYYADAYINFNELVTDLFKVYKTRIWMSAINPASFASAAGLTRIPPPSAIGPGAVAPAEVRARPSFNALPPAMPSPVVQMTGPAPVGMGYDRAGAYENTQVHSPVNMVEEARKAHAMGVPLGMTSFTNPGVNALNYQFPQAATRSRNDYYPFESQIPSYQGANMQANQYAAMMQPPQPFSKFNQYAAAAGAYPGATYPSPVQGMIAFSGNFPATTRPSPVIGSNGLTSGAFPTASRPSPAPGMGGFTAGISGPSSPPEMTPGASGSGNYGYNANQANTFYNPYAGSPAPAPTAPAASASSSRTFYPDDDWVARMNNLNLAINKSQPARK